MPDQIWEIRASEGGSTGLEVARGRLGATGRVLAHALPSRVDVEVRDESGARVAKGERLESSERTPIARLEIVGDAVHRELIWPEDEDLGTPVILPGGEVGILTKWWHADDHSEWRWSIELHNRA